MHIPDGLLAGPVWGALALAGAAGLSLAVKRANERIEERQVPLLGVTAAFVFAAQMVNVPVAAGTSAHFVGSALVGIALGPWAGLVVMAVVLLIQCLAFGDGGVTALGANFCNMGILGVGSAWLMVRLVTARWSGPRGQAIGAFLGAWLASVLSAVACVAELSLSGALPFGPALAVMTVLHSLTGVAEGVVTVSALRFLQRVRPDILPGAWQDPRPQVPAGAVR